MSAFSAPARPAVDVAVLQGEIEAIFGFRCSVPSFFAGRHDPHEVIGMTARIHRRSTVTGLISEYRRAAPFRRP
ncbi:hypothetical protein [Nonomuraea sp. NPDC049709]|uniref:hypothetical protein n=1 Tax=Nonomuraea sp. NPDC049709 TaxID=3154736 RepID=UPI003423E0E2